MTDEIQGLKEFILAPGTGWGAFAVTAVVGGLRLLLPYFQTDKEMALSREDRFFVRMEHELEVLREENHRLRDQVDKQARRIIELTSELAIAKAEIMRMRGDEREP